MERSDLVDLTKYLSGKISLNDFVHRINQSGASFHVHYWGVMPRHYDNQLHKHSFFEVCFVVDGEGTYMDEQSSYTLKKKHDLFIKTRSTASNKKRAWPVTTLCCL